jgi:hypothetical protein
MTAGRTMTRTGHNDLAHQRATCCPGASAVEPVLAHYVESGGVGRFLSDPVIGIFIEEGAFVLACCAIEEDARAPDDWLNNRGRAQ